MKMVSNIIYRPSVHHAVSFCQECCPVLSTYRGRRSLITSLMAVSDLRAESATSSTSSSRVEIEKAKAAVIHHGIVSTEKVILVDA